MQFNVEGIFQLEKIALSEYFHYFYIKFDNILFKYMSHLLYDIAGPYYAVERSPIGMITQWKKWVVGMVGGRQRCHIAPFHCMIIPPGITLIIIY